MDTPDPEPGPLHTALVAVTVCLICSALVSTTAVLLRPLQEANRDQERREMLLDIIARQPGLHDLFSRLESVAVESRVIELESGAFADWIDPAEFDAHRAARDPLQSDELAPEHDPAGLGRLARYATAYLVRRGERVELVILPVHGQGYASTIYGFVALAEGGSRVAGLSFYEHGETPGLGAQIDDPEWLATWVGKRVRDDSGRVLLGVAGGEARGGTPGDPYTVDALSGATITADSVTRMLRFWLGERGFGPFLARIAR